MTKTPELQHINFTLIYEISPSLNFLTFDFLFPLVFVFGGIFMYRNTSIAKGFIPIKYIKPMAISWVLVALLVIGGSVLTKMKKYRLNNAYQSGQFNVVQGTIQNFSNIKGKKHGEESFDVNDIHFHYASNRITGGFNKMSDHNAPLKEGVLVKISYIGSIIVKLEVQGEDQVSNINN